MSSTPGTWSASSTCFAESLNEPHLQRTVPRTSSTGRWRTSLSALCGAIHNCSFDIFRASRREARGEAFGHSGGYIERDQTGFAPEQRSTLVDFIQDVDTIIKVVAKARATKQLPATKVRMPLLIYSSWTKRT